MGTGVNSDWPAASFTGRLPRLSRQSRRLNGAFWVAVFCAYAAALFACCVFLADFLVWFTGLAPAAAGCGFLAMALMTIFIWKTRRGRFKSARFYGRLTVLVSLCAAVVSGIAAYEIWSRSVRRVIETHREVHVNEVPVFILIVALELVAVTALIRSLRRVGLWDRLSSRLDRFTLQRKYRNPARRSYVLPRPRRFPEWRKIQRRFGKQRLLASARSLRRSA